MQAEENLKFTSTINFTESTIAPFLNSCWNTVECSSTDAQIDIMGSNTAAQQSLATAQGMKSYAQSEAGQGLCYSNATGRSHPQQRL